MTTPLGSTPRLGLTYGGTQLGVRSDDRATLTWLAEFLAPAFSASACGADDYSIAFDDDPAACARLAQRAAAANCVETECFSNDGYFARFPAWTDAAGATWIQCEADAAFLQIPATGTDLQLIVQGDPDLSRLTLMRVVRELATLEQWQWGRWLLHGAAFASAGQAVVVCGPKNAGKTTMLMHALQAGCALIANDRVVVDLPASQPVVRGMPSIVCVRAPTLEFFPGLAEQCAQAHFQRARTIAECRTADETIPAPSWTPGSLPTLSGAQLCGLFGTRAVQSAPLTKVLFPSVQPQARGAELIPLTPDEAAERLAENILVPCRPLRWPNAWRCLTACAPPTWQRLVEQCRRLASRVGCYRCVLGPDAYRSGIPWIEPRRLAA